MSYYIQVSEDENEEPIELPVEEDGSLLLSTLVAQFPGACGLKFRPEDGKAMRGLRLVDGHLYPPEESENVMFICAFPKENKRKSDDVLNSSYSKTQKLDSSRKCSDLIVLGLPWKTTEEELKTYFESYGEILMAEIKKDPKSGQSKGFGFIRFGNYESQLHALKKRHVIDGRFCDVRIPNSKGENAHRQTSCKIFVGRLTEDLTASHIKEYFSKYGDITDVYIPRPFRGFAFVSFDDCDVAQTLYGEDHIIEGVSVHVSVAEPKNDGGGGGGGGGGRYGNMEGRGGQYGGQGNSKYNNNPYGNYQNQNPYSVNDWGREHDNTNNQQQRRKYNNSGGFSSNSGGYSSNSYGRQF